MSRHRRIEPILAGTADRAVVFDLVEDLRKGWETVLNDYARSRAFQTERGGVRYVDALMAGHNFFKLIVMNLADDAGLVGREKAAFYRGAAVTFTQYMTALADKAEREES